MHTVVVQAYQSKGVGQPKGWETAIPVWGSGRTAVDHFQNGNYWRGIGYSALAISDVFLVKAAVTAIGKGIAVGVSKVAANTTTNNVNRIYSARELLRRSAEPGPFHNFPEVFNKVIFEKGTQTVTSNYFNVAKPGLSNTNILYKYPGTINGTQGFFEIGVRPSVSGRTEVIVHRFFNPTR